MAETEFGEVRSILVDRLRSAAAAGINLFDPDIEKQSSLLFHWWRAEGREPVQQYLTTVFNQDPAQVGRFLVSIVGRSWSTDSVTELISDLRVTDYKNIERLIEPKIMADIIKKHFPGDFKNATLYPDSGKPPANRLIEQFMYFYNKPQETQKDESN